MNHVIYKDVDGSTRSVIERIVPVSIHAEEGCLQCQGDMAARMTGAFLNLLPPSSKPASGHKGVKEARFDLLPYDALWEVSRVFGKGAAKYAERNWERGYEWSKSFGAIQRHVALWWQGEDLDPETGLSHLAHAVCNTLFLMAFQARQAGTDNRSRSTVGMTAVVTNPEDIAAANAEVKSQETK